MRKKSNKGLRQKELYFLNLFFKKYSCFNFGTVDSKTLIAHNIFSIVIKSPDGEILKNFIAFNTLDDLKEKITRFFNLIKTSKGIRHIEDFKTYNEESCLNTFEKNAQKIFLLITKNPYIQELLNTEIVYENLVNKKFLASNSKYCYFIDSTLDSTFGTGLCLTFLQDSGGRLIGPYILTEGFPSSYELVELMDRVFFRRNTGVIEEVILHSDRCNEYTSKLVEEYCKLKGIKHSYTTPEPDPKRKHPKGDPVSGNNVIERYNRTVWDVIFSLRYKEDKNKTITFKDVSFAEKLRFIDVAFLWINNNEANSSLGIADNASSRMTSEALNIYQMSENYLAEPETSEGLRIIYFLDLSTEKYKQSLLLAEFALDNPNLPLLLVSENPESVISENNIVKADEDPLKILKEVKYIKKMNKFISKKIINSSPKADEDPYSFFNNMLKKFNNSSTEFKATAGLFLGIQSTMLSLKNSKRIEFMEKEIKLLHAKLDRERRESLICQDFVRVKTGNRQRQKIRSIRSKSPKHAVFWSDLKIILDNVSARFDYLRARDRVLHFFLKATGMRIGCSVYLTWFQIDRFVNQKAYLTFKVEKPEGYSKILNFPYYKGLNPFVKILHNDFLILKHHAEKIRNEDLTLPRDRSEFWGYCKKNNKKVDINSTAKRINLQLSKAALFLLKDKEGNIRKLTTHSYRRGVAIVTNAFFGISVTQQVLNHVSILTTQQYVENSLNKNQIIDIYQKGLTIQGYDDLPSVNTDKLERSRYIAETEDILSKEKKETLKEILDDLPCNDSFSDF